MNKKILITTALCGMIAGVTQAATFRYMGTGNWEDNQWQNQTLGLNNVAPPTATDLARANWGAGQIVTLNSAVTVQQFETGVDENGGILIAHGGTLNTTDHLRIGLTDGNTGTLVVNAGGTAAAGNILYIGLIGSAIGSVDVNGGTITTVGHLWMGGGTTSMGTMNINAGGVVNVGGTFGLGTINASTASGGTGFLNVNSGGLLTMSYWTTGSIQSGSLLSINGTGVVEIGGNRVAQANDFFAAGLIASDLGDIEAVYNEGTDTTTITASSAGYAGWELNYPTLTGTRDDDDDGDGLSNLEEYAVGGNPTNANDRGYAPSYAVSGDDFDYIHVRRTTPGNNLTYYLEQDDNLVASPGWIYNEDYTVVGIDPMPADSDFEIITNRISTLGKSQEFVQLKVYDLTLGVGVPLLNTNVFGATLPFVTQEAEAASAMSGTIVELAIPYPWPYTSAQEASGRAYVELANTGEYVEFNVLADANAMVLRHCIPDAPGGGGISATLGVYVNGEWRQDITLTSKFTWLYGPATPVFGNGQDNTPTGYPHVFWDEARVFIAGGVNAGDVIRFEKQAGDTAAYYRIDLLELELVPPPLTRPAGSLSIADFGADGSSAANDTAAIKNCIAAAKTQGKTVWFPVGNFLQNEYFWLVDGVTVQGAGMWYTTLSETVGPAATAWHANAGFRLSGDGNKISDMTFNSTATMYRDDATTPKAFTGGGNNWVIENIWVTHLGVGLWLNGDNGIVRNCRIRVTYADGINVNTGGPGSTVGMHNVLIVNNHVRGCGDDGIAVLDEQNSTGTTSGAVVHHNTVELTWWGGDIDLTGGKDHLIYNNLLRNGRGFVVNLPSGYKMKTLKDSVFINNKLINCGKRANWSVNDERGAIWILPNSAEIESLTIENNRIIDPIFKGIHCQGTLPQNILFKNNKISNSGDHAVYISTEAVGSGTFIDNVSTNSGVIPVLRNDSANYTVFETNNVWQ